MQMQCLRSTFLRCGYTADSSYPIALEDWMLVQGIERWPKRQYHSTLIWPRCRWTTQSTAKGTTTLSLSKNMNLLTERVLNFGCNKAESWNNTKITGVLNLIFLPSHSINKPDCCCWPVLARQHWIVPWHYRQGLCRVPHLPYFKG